MHDLLCSSRPVFRFREFCKWSSVVLECCLHFVIFREENVDSRKWDEPETPVYSFIARYFNHFLSSNSDFSIVVNYR